MEVLVALKRADGRVVSREELIEVCWGGRIVSEDAVQRCIARLRRLFEADPDTLVIAADTTVDLGGDILGKPADTADAVAMLRRLSGRTHRVHTGVAMCRAGRMVHEVVTSMVSFTPLTDATIEWYVGTGEPLDKAGAYAIQGAGGAFVQTMRGSVSSIVGLPLHTVVRLAADLGCRFAAVG